MTLSTHSCIPLRQINRLALSALILFYGTDPFCLSTGVMGSECLGILRSFFSMRRAEAKTHPVANREISELDDQNEMPS